MRVEEEIGKVAPEAFFDYLKDSSDALDSIIGDLIRNVKVAIINADGDMRAKADALENLGALRQILAVTVSHIQDLNHDNSELSDLLLKTAKGLLVVYEHLKAGASLREAELALGDLTLDVSIFIGDTVRHAVEKLKGPQETQVSAAAQGSSA